MPRRLLILGAGVMQGPAIRLAREQGLETIAVDGDPKAPCVSSADRFERIDLKDKEALEAFARSLKDSGGLAGVLTAGTDFSASVAWVAERLGLPGISYETALNASDKERMRRCFAAAGVPSPKFTILREPPMPGLSLPFPYPMVVKPVDNMGSRGCRRADGPEDLRKAVEDALSFSRSGRAIVEEYMEGPEFSIDSIVYRGNITICGVADRHIFFPPYFIEMGHTIPSDLDSRSMEKLLGVFKQGVKALGITDGAAKGDVKLTPRGPMIGEIAARLSGGYMSGWTYPYASGVEPTRGAIAVALGEAPTDLEPKKNWTCAERAFISIPGVVRSIENAEEVRRMGGVKDVFFRIVPGSRVVFPENNVTKGGNIIVHAPTRDDAIYKAEKAARRVWIRLEAPDPGTEAFLARGPALPDSVHPSFPPDAYPLPPLLERLYRSIPECAPSPDEAQRGDFRVCPFPELFASSLKDYMGRTPEESFEAASILSGCSISISSHTPNLGRGFWASLIRGGYQGAAYYVDALRSRFLDRGNSTV
jgi:biotin carboxylase